MRMPPLVLSALMALLASFAAAQQQLPPSPAAAAAWAAFERGQPGPWLVQWNAATGTPRSIVGNGYPLADWRESTLAEARRHAHAELARHAALLGLGTSELRECIGARMGRTWTLSFDQHFRGLRVVGGRADVRIHGTGRVCFLGSTAWPVPAGFDVVPRLDEANAVARAWLALGREPVATPQPGRPRAPELVILGDANAAAPSPLALAWEVPIRAVDANGDGPFGRAYVDARTGAWLAWTDDKHACGERGCTGDAHARTAAPPSPTRPAPPPTTTAPVPTTFTVRGFAHSLPSPVSAPTNEPLAGIEIQVPGTGVVVTDANGQFTVDLAAPVAVTVELRGEHSNLVGGPGAPVVAATLQPGVPATLQLGAAAAAEHELAHTTAYFWTDRINRWARGILGNTPQLAIASDVTPSVNIASTCNAWYGGNSINFYASGGGCNNTASASVVAHEWGHGLDDRYGGISQTNGLSEGWGDVCSMYLLDDPTIGHDFFAGGGALRSGTNNQQYPQGSGPHAQGLSWMGFAWKFRESLRQSLGAAQAIAISNDVVLASIAANAVSQPDAVVAAFLADDDDGILGNGTPHRAHLVAACQAHNLPFPPLLPGALAHAPLANTRLQLVPRRVEVDAVPYGGTFTQVRVHWNDGQPRQRALVPAGVADRWHGLLPGVAAPQVVPYHVEAVHSGGAVVRLPATGEWQYATLAERRVWLDGFENGGAGWTHGATAGTDDWQVGAPAGASGPQWTDPAAAASGQQCAGTNLSLANAGAYSPSSDMWLRSPPIDCTGVTGLRLRFARHASCAGPTDRLEVRVAGVLAWSSSFQLLQESGWTTFETTVPAADGQPAVVVEFRLLSDALQQFGGWNVDDVELYSLGHAVPLPASLALQPEQALQGAPVTLQVQALPAQPFLLVLGDAPGPTTVPGFPTVQAGGNLATLLGFTDATGAFSTTFAAPPAPVTGVSFWSQVLTLDATGAVFASNAFVNLFTQ
jgi:hypothetical protein